MASLANLSGLGNFGHSVATTAAGGPLGMAPMAPAPAFAYQNQQASVPGSQPAFGMQVKVEPQQHAAQAGQIITSPYSAFRDMARPHPTEHGCPHLFQLFQQPSPNRPADGEGPRTRKQDLMDDYAAAVRYSLTCRYRSELKSGLEARAGSARKRKLDEDMDEDGHATDEMRERSNLEKAYRALDKIKVPSCSTCKACVSRIHACLECTAMGCWSSGKGGENHIRSHLDQTGHTFALDMSAHTVYCRQCRDYVYDVELERLLALERVGMSESVAFLLSSLAPGATSSQDTPLSPSASRSALIPLIASKRHRYSPRPLPTPASLQAVRQHFKLPPQCPRGLRGLRNLGSTCFMNVVLQTVVHNPVLRSWWLGDGHNGKTCPRGRDGVCMACQVDSLFSQFYSGMKYPFGPSSFLHALWVSQIHLAGYSQQDAHEFFISLLNQLHLDLAPGQGERHQPGCRCIVHQSFGGVLQSDVRCERCGGTTTAWDPILDLSLELKGLARPGGAPVNLDDPGAPPPALTLAECLDRFTHPERLSAGSYTCTRCGSNNGGATKQMSVRTLPQVLGIQFKRFEHRLGHVSVPGKPAKVKGEGRKVDTYVRVPVKLDMEGYTAAAVRRRRQRSDAIAPSVGPMSPLMSPTASPASMAWAATGRKAGEEREGGRVHPDPGYQYSLFAVIEHIGKLDSGHYRAYVKSRGQWFAFDDHVVTLTSQKHVLDCKAYMTFYVKDTFDFGDEPEPLPEKLSPLQQFLPQAPIVLDDDDDDLLPMQSHGSVTTGHVLLNTPPPGPVPIHRSPSTVSSGGARPLPKVTILPPAPPRNGMDPSKKPKVAPSPSPMPSMAGKTLPGYVPGASMVPPPTGTFSPSPGTPPGRVGMSPGTPPSQGAKNGTVKSTGNSPVSTGPKSGRASPMVPPPPVRQMSEEELAAQQWSAVIQSKNKKI
ncbi:hypothetical protein DFJ74DRAFT_617757 [Hyaloraphidium curvatum]|nr:hypothetical protein DFJ74DRAFT_617757 [Hyaloraphidium curvatum]